MSTSVESRPTVGQSYIGADKFPVAFPRLIVPDETRALVADRAGRSDQERRSGYASSSTQYIWPSCVQSGAAYRMNRRTSQGNTSPIGRRSHAPRVARGLEDLSLFRGAAVIA